MNTEIQFGNVAQNEKGVMSTYVTNAQSEQRNGSKFT
jgi:hypothetical protein